ncbi:peptidase U32 family protein [Caminibacter pacificus]|uniref:Protease n=1 Tax=Caminibacter pacificus TaxID=1424653 RepID=A0AAJ4UXI3_9BACT|nr:peptidase U32 family protein [Caminibacter pacificus]NPA88468.1 U32 family peptidase [Campylobacterota bacterium]QCI28907.1 U32 family peptidase [Caminibacter pacificus]ROR39498.1 putative protease [Caminibacter pacificus]
MKKPELLAPAGDFEKLKIAIEYGADAVYAGVSHFSLRCHSGKEFDYETFKEAVDYAHERGVKVYATVNSFPFENQLPLVESHIKKLKEIGVDAMIISTLGVIAKAKEIAPEIDIHLSTQANALNSWDYKAYRDFGVKRIIAARETSLKDLIKIKEKVPDVEIEIFVHGAMCFAYSGRCLLSAVQFGRNPNKGSCANDCRYPYVLYAENPETGTMFKMEEYEDGTYIMNAKDLCLIKHIPEILDAGVVDSLKIEGRTKAPYYVAVVTKAYRDAIDEYLSSGKCDCEKYYKEILTTKNRGLTDAYLVKRPYERDDTQNLETSLTHGEWQVSGVVTQEGDSFMCKYKTFPGDVVEILLPKNAKISPCENEIGKIWQEDGKWYLKFNKIVTKSGKELNAVHSGNQNPIMLPCKLPPLTFLRKKVEYSPNGV